MEWGNLRNWLSGSIRNRDQFELREAWKNGARLWEKSPLATLDQVELIVGIVREAARKARREPARQIQVAACEVVEYFFDGEQLRELVAQWDIIENDLSVALEVKELIARRDRWSTNFDYMLQVFRKPLVNSFADIFDMLPNSCFATWTDKQDIFSVPLLDLVDNPLGFIEHLFLTAYDDDALKYEVFYRFRERLVANMLIASGFSPDANPYELQDKLLLPTHNKKLTVPYLSAATYLNQTPFLNFSQFLVPFHIPPESRFEHCHIVGGTGHGKTQLMQKMVFSDLLAAQTEKRSVVVIDSQGDLINKLVRLSLFDPDTPNSLADRLVLVDPADVEYPFSLNLFDTHVERIQSYKPADRERVLNGVIELYELFFSSMLGAELTQKQGVIFRYIARLMITIPEATIFTLMQLMEDGKPFKLFMDKLDGSARHFFQTEFFHPSFAATKKQILKRLWGVLSTPAFERMFAQKSNKLDLFKELNDGKIILISTAKDLLKNEGSALFGKFFIAMLSQAALERSTIAPDQRTPTFVYIDEAQEYFDDSIETILSQARKYKVALTLAHQTLDQFTPRLRSAVLSNTSFKCVGGVSSRDARAIAEELRTDADFIESMRRTDDQSEFAVWLKNQTSHAVRLTIPLGFLERQSVQSEEAFASIMENNRSKYCCALADLPRFEFEAKPTSETEAKTIFTEKPLDEDVPEPISVSVQQKPRTLDEIVQKPKIPTIEKELGKGGSQHRYVQHLIKGLAEERGFRAVIEAPVQGGQVDVALYLGELSIACEVSVTSKIEYEIQNIEKCLMANFSHVLAVGNDVKKVRTLESKAKELLSTESLARTQFLAIEDLSNALDALTKPPDQENVVRGYKVKVTHTTTVPADAKDRRSSIARIIAQSLRNMPDA